MWDLPWSASETLISRRITEELLKRNYGEPKVEFSIPIKWIDVFDIFSNLRLQEPFGLDLRDIDPSLRGEYGRYYYIESMTYDFLNQKINVVAIDLQYLIGRCMLVSHCGDVPDDWMNATQVQRMYAYVGSCATESFEDGEPLKLVCKCE